MVCEQTLGLLNATDLRDLSDEDADLLEHLDYNGLVGAHSHHEAIVCARHFALIRDKLLRVHPWVFARKEASLAQLAACPLPGWRYGYALPSNCLTLLALIERSHSHWPHGPHEPLYCGYMGGYFCRHHATGSVNLAHYEQAGTIVGCNHKPVHARYTARIEDTEKWDATFTEVFCFALAEQIAVSVVSDRGLALTLTQKMERQKEKGISEARTAGLIAEATELPFQMPLWMDYSGVRTGFDDHGKWGY
jgi:hypothetical protein